VPPQPNSPPVCVPDADRKKLKSRRARRHSAPPGKWDDVESSSESCLLIDDDFTEVWLCEVLFVVLCDRHV